MGAPLEALVEGWLLQLCGAHPDRHVGGPGNRAATDLFVHAANAAGFEVESAELDCIEWDVNHSWLDIEGARVPLHVGPYSLPVDATAPLTAVSSIEELEAGELAGTVLLVHGALAAEQLMPKNFVFYNPESHRRILRALESQAPVAVIAATGKNPDLAGALYPFPLIEDGDFDIPNGYVTDVVGLELLGSCGADARVRIDSRRISSSAAQPIAVKRGSRAGRIVCFAHIDSKDGSPGALDNATGVAALLGMMDLLAEKDLAYSLEVVPLNGEDYYAATGQMHYLKRNRGRWGDIVLGINLDGAGLAGDQLALSFYSADESLRATALAIAGRHGMAQGAQWFQGDHGLFLMNGVPALAVTSQAFARLTAELAHTPHDTLDNVDVAAVADVARFLGDLATGLGS